MLEIYARTSATGLYKFYGIFVFISIKVNVYLRRYIGSLNN